jgi:hypothetical protein
MALDDSAAWYREEAARLKARASALRGDTDTALRLFRMASQMELLGDQLADDENQTMEKRKTDSIRA